MSSAAVKLVAVKVKVWIPTINGLPVPYLKVTCVPESNPIILPFTRTVAAGAEEQKKARPTDINISIFFE